MDNKVKVLKQINYRAGDIQSKVNIIMYCVIISIIISLISLVIK